MKEKGFSYVQRNSGNQSDVLSFVWFVLMLMASRMILAKQPLDLRQ